MVRLRELVLALFSEKKPEPRLAASGSESHDVILKAPPEPRVEPAPVAAAAASEKTDDSPRLEPSPPTRDETHCPKCNSELWRAFCCGKRCAQCGHQENVASPAGVSRRDYELGLYRKKAVINSAHFHMARVRLLGR